MKSPVGLSKQVPAVVMLSGDRENLRKAKEEGVNATGLRGYVSGLEAA